MLQVETSVFAMSFKKPPSTMPFEFDTSSCEMDLVFSLLSDDYIFASIIFFLETPLGC